MTAAYLQSIPHPPGFPLYILMSSLMIKIVDVSTIAWRVGLMSALSIILARIMLFQWLKKLFNSLYLAICAVSIFSFLYPVWLFSSIPEVIMLLILFLSIIMYLSFDKNITKPFNIAFLAFVAGLAIFHNYLILITFPSLIYYLYVKHRSLFVNIQNRLMVILFFFLGATPYIFYLSMPLRTTPLDTSFPNNLFELIRLMTRSDYGAFRLSRNVSFSLSSAFTSLLNLINFIVSDFKIIGCIFILLGVITIWRQKDKAVRNFFILNLGTFIVFFFYASFPFTINFTAGTFEKYLLIPYLFLVIILVLGVKSLVILINHQLHNHFLRHLAKVSLYISLAIYVVILFVNNSPKILLLKDDRTAENLGYDVLNTVEKGAIVNLKGDTITYNSLYVTQVLHHRADVKFINFLRLNDTRYQKKIKSLYPDVTIPAINQKYEITVNDFLIFNSDKFTIYSSEPIDSKNSTWLPKGILWKYYPETDALPNSKALILENLKIWDLYHSPFSGSLSKYKNLLLSDVLRTYALGHWSFAELLNKDAQYRLAKGEYEQAYNLWPENSTITKSYKKNLNNQK